jgi:pilus assembly protein CpaE
VNVATALAKVAPSQTLFADLHVANGDAALLFGVEPRFSIADALENTHRFDEAFFRGLVTPTKAKADLLASSDRALVQQSGIPHFRPVVEFAVQLYRYVILDVPRPDAMAIDALDLASRIVVVTNQELSAVRSASRLASVLRDRHGRDRVLVVVNRSDKQSEIGQADIEKVVAAKVKHMLPSDYRLALEALNKGRPLALDNHNKLAAGFRGLAKELANVETEPKPSEPASSLFGRLTGRG